MTCYQQVTGSQKAGRILSRSQRLLCLVALAFFCFLTGRFYLSTQLDPEACLELGHIAAFPLSDHQHHSHSHLLPSQSEKDPGFFFQHCKDTYEGILLSPAQPFGVPSPVFLEPPQSLWTDQPGLRAQLPDNLPSLPFHPPKHLG
ncbi:MAG: hypothetical protein HY649_02540 [Acidobacteria bacterium]|nr:hypothetical protein [Acidobacteriota bacterium]